MNYVGKGDNGGCCTGCRYYFIIASEIGRITVPLALFAASLIALIVLAGISPQIATLDKAVAAWANNAGYQLNTGIVYFLNELVYVLIIFPAAFYVYMVLMYIFALRLRGMKYMYYQLLPLIAVGCYFAMAFLTLVGLKKGLARPRPWYTIEFGYNSSNVECQLPFYPGFRHSALGPSLCGYKPESCPSGHTLLATTCGTSTLYEALCGLRLVKESQAFGVASRRAILALRVVSTLFLVFSLILLLIFVPAIMLARIVAAMHFFTDVAGGFLLGLVCYAVMPLLAPAPPRGAAQPVPATNQYIAITDA